MKMNKARAVERVIGRIYKDKLEKGGSLPSGKEVLEMKKKAIKAAEKVDKTRERS